MDTARAKTQLEEEKARLERELASVGRPSPSGSGDWEPLPNDQELESDPVDQADVVTHLEENSAILADLEARYAYVAGALGRLSEGTYGLCEVCGKVIEEKRLLADPAATTCIEHL